MSGIESHPTHARVTHAARIATPRSVVICGALVALAICTGCEGGRVTVFDPVKRSLADSLVVQGDRALQDGRRDSARSLLNRALRLEPEHAVANALLGEMAHQDRDYAAAVEYFQAAVKANPNHPGYATRLGDSLGHLAATAMSPHRTWARAARAYGYARTLERDSYSLRVSEAKCLRETGDFDKALSLLAEARQLAPGREEALLETAQVWRAAGNGTEALAACREALFQAPDSTAAHNLAALVLLESEAPSPGVLAANRARAMSHLRRSLEIDPAQESVRRRLDEMAMGGTSIASGPNGLE